MDPAVPERAVDPRWLQLQPGPHPSPVNSSVGNDAYFSEIERLDRIGGGVAGTVYKALHRPSGRLYALKVISGHHHQQDCSPRCRIFHDIKAIGDVDPHPNVVSCHGVHDSGGEVQVLLDYVDGGSLEGVHIGNEQRLSKLAIQMLSGLAHLHERKIVHRDLKPSSLLVDSLGNIKIADCISRILAQNMDTWELSGRPVPYMSPERINPDLKNGDYDESSGDIWSVGVCILEIYVGRFPYANGKQMNWLGLMFKIGNSEPPQAPPTASIEFRDFIACCLQKDPGKRWTADQLLRHPFVLQLNDQERVSTELTEPPPAMAAADPTKLDLNLSLGGLHTALPDASFKLSDAETEHISLIDSNITDQSESTDVCPSSDGSKKSDRTENQQVQSGVVPTESTEGLEVEQASLEVPAHQDWQDLVDPFDRAEKCKKKMKSVINDQVQREDISILSGGENPRAACYRENQPDTMRVGSPEKSDDEQNFSEARPNSNISMDHIENDLHYTDPDTEDATMLPAGQIYQKLMASRVGGLIKTSNIHMQSHQCGAVEEQCLPVEWSIDANIDKRKTDLLRGCGQIDDMLSGEQSHRNTSKAANSVEIQTIPEEQLAGQLSCPEPPNFSISQQAKLKKGPWSSDEDQKLVDYIKRYGIWNWQYMPMAAGLNRSGKSCRLRWMNYLRPNIKRGKFSEDEEQVILRLHQTLGNRWQAIAKSLPGRTDNEIKNFWNTHLKKKVLQVEKDQKKSRKMGTGNSGETIA